MNQLEGINDDTKKRLFVCCDGTWENAASSMHHSTNVARFARCVWRLERDGYKPESQAPGIIRSPHVVQVVWYSGGVGTYASLMSEWIWSGVTGTGVTSIILNAYHFLCSNYNFAYRNDEIILVGYSRGAFAVRCVAEFISEVGLLRRKGLPYLGLLFRLWMDGKEKEKENPRLKGMIDKLLEGDPALLDQRIRIKVLAEFDPVSAIVDPSQLFRTKHKRIADVQDQVCVPKAVENAFLAMALNEKRSEFKPMLWEKQATAITRQVKQCAFLGCHGDIGGGNADSGLSQLPLLWMIDRIKQATSNSGIGSPGAQFDEDQLLEFSSPSTVEYPESIGGGKYSFETFSSTRGEITESLTYPWSVYYCFKKILTLGFGQGERVRSLGIKTSGNGTADSTQDENARNAEGQHEQVSSDEARGGGVQQRAEAQETAGGEERGDEDQVEEEQHTESQDTESQDAEEQHRDSEGKGKEIQHTESQDTESQDTEDQHSEGKGTEGQGQHTKDQTREGPEDESDQEDPEVRPRQHRLQVEPVSVAVYEEMSPEEREEKWQTPRQPEPKQEEPTRLGRRQRGPTRIVSPQGGPTKGETNVSENVDPLEIHCSVRLLFKKRTDVKYDLGALQGYNAPQGEGSCHRLRGWTVDSPSNGDLSRFKEHCPSEQERGFLQIWGENADKWEGSTNRSSQPDLAHGSAADMDWDTKKTQSLAVFFFKILDDDSDWKLKKVSKKFKNAKIKEQGLQATTPAWPKNSRR